MSPLATQILLYAVYFVLIWIGSGLVVSSITRLATHWKLSSFTVSFFLLGLLTSLPEIAISTTAIASGNPTIAVGNLLGGIIVMFLLIIPLLGFFGNRIKIPKNLSPKHMMLILTVVVAPALLATDQRINQWEGVLMVLLYALLFIFLFRKHSVAERLLNSLKNRGKKRSQGWTLLFKIVVGILIVLGASDQIVESTLYFASVLEVSPFIVSLVIISLGTNIPELSIIVHSIRQKQKDVALADYLGSAVANTLLLGIVAIFYGQAILLPNHFLSRLAFLMVGLVLFLIFSRTKNMISKRESLILLACYAAFLWLELQPFLQ